jgi:translocation and assembly module TamB
MPEAADVLARQGKWSLSVTQVTLRSGRLESLRLDAGDTTAVLTGTFAENQLTAGIVTVDVRGIGRIAGIADDRSTSRFIFGVDRLTTTGEGEGTIAINVSGLREAPPLRANARWTADRQSLRIAALSGLSEEIKLSGQSAWTRDGNAFDHRATEIDLTMAPPAFGMTVGKDLRLAARVAGPLTALQATVTARSAQLGAEANAFTDLDANLTLARAGPALDANLDVKATWRGVPVTLAASARKAQDSLLRIEEVRAESIAGHLEGAVAVDTASGLADGNLAVKLADIAPLADAFGVDAKGALDATLTLSHRDGLQRASTRAELARLITNPLRVGTVSLTANVQDVWRTRMFDVRLTTTPGIFLGGPVKAVNVSVSGAATSFTAALKTEPAGRARFGLDLAADVVVDESTTVTVTRLALQDDALTVALGGPATVRIGAARIAADNVTLKVAGGTAVGNLNIDRIKNTVSSTIDAKGIIISDLAPAGYVVPPGIASARIVLGGALGDATLDANLTAQFPADRRSATPAFSVGARATAQAGRLDFSARVEGLSAQPATVAFDVPFRIDLTGPRIIIEENAAITATASWRGSIAPLWRLLPIEEHLLSGDLELDAAVSGTLAAPLIRGGLHLAGGTYENIPGGTVLRNLDLRLSTARGDDLALSGTATDAGGGKAQFSGKLVREAGGWNADLAADLDRMALLARDDVTGAASGKLSYTGPLLGGTLRGGLAVVRGMINLDATGVPEVPLLRSHEFSKASNGAPAPAVAPAPITFDVSLSFADPLRVEGAGLESAWRGELYVAGTLAKPDVSGRLTLERGTFTFLGQSFGLESGTVTFTGGGRIDPQLAVTAVREVADITATVQINGPTASPTITLSSRPALPQDEVLARLLFNRAAGELGPIESIQLASAAADMSGLARGGISGVVRRTFGLDTFSFGGQSGSAVVVGRQINRNIFVSVEQSVNSTNRVFIISWRLTRHLSLRSSANDETGADFGVFWRKDY